MRKIDTLSRVQLVTIGKKLKIGNYSNSYNKPYLKKNDLKFLIVSYLTQHKDSINSITTHVSKTNIKKNLSLKSSLSNTISKNIEPTIDKCCFPKVEKLVAIGDIHGDLVVAIKCLKLAGVINNNIPNNTRIINNVKWIGGKTHVVQLGDQIDRVRPNALINDICPKDDDGIYEDEGSDLKIITLFNNLHKQALKQGGACFSILGNHELMNVDGDFRYVSPREFREFGNFFKASKSIKNGNYPYGYNERKLAFQCGGSIAVKLANTRYSILQVGSWIFVHGGLTPKIADEYSFDEINKAIKDWLMGCKKPETLTNVNKIYHTDDDTNSPFWSRMFSDNEEWIPRESENLFLNTLSNANIKNNRNRRNEIKGMIVGHSPQFMYEKGINSACNNSLWRVDAGMSRAFGPINQTDEDYNNRKAQVLVIKNDTNFCITKEK
jgi:hypothetical protein